MCLLPELLSTDLGWTASTCVRGGDLGRMHRCGCCQCLRHGVLQSHGSRWEFAVAKISL